MREQDWTRIPSDGRRRTHAAHVVAPRPEVHARCQPRQGIRDQVGDRQPRQPECLSGEPVRPSRGRTRYDGRDARIGARSKDRADPAHRVSGDRCDCHLRPGENRFERGKRIRTELTGTQRQVVGGVRTVGPNVKRQAVEARRIQEQGHRERPVTGRFPAMDQDYGGSGCSAPGGDEPGREIQPVARDRQGFVGEPDIGWGQVRRTPARIAGAHAIGQRESVRQPRCRGGDGGSKPGPADSPHGV